MSKLEIINKFFFQLLFVRLTKCTERIIDEVDLHEISLMPSGYGTGVFIKKQHTEQWYSLMYWVIPFTGWKSKFKFIGKMNLKKITKNKIIN